MSKRQNTTQFPLPHQPAKVLPSIPKPLSTRTPEVAFEQSHISSPSNSISRELESAIPSAGEIPAKSLNARAGELELEPESSGTLAPFSDALDSLDTVKDTVSSRISNESNPRKRKSVSKERKLVPESRKPNKRRRLFKRHEASANEVAHSSPRAPAEAEISPVKDLQKVCVFIALADSIRNTNTEVSNNPKTQTQDPRSTEFGHQSVSFSEARFGSLRHPVQGPGGPHLNGGFLPDRTQNGGENQERHWVRQRHHLQVLIQVIV